MKIYAADYGVFPGDTDVKALERLLLQLADTDKDKELIFERGIYKIRAAALTDRMLYITNTVGDQEFSAQEIPHQNRAMLYLKQVNNLVIDGNGALFLADGKCTNAAFEDCKNITLRRIAFSAVNPDMHELKVIAVTPTSVDFEIDAESEFCYEDGNLFFTGSDYKKRIDTHIDAHWIGLIRQDTPDRVQRVAHPLAGSTALQPLDGRSFRVRYADASRFLSGDCFYVYDVRRQYAGIFLNRCKNTVLYEVAQHFNYSLALVAQDCENIRCNGLNFAPAKTSARKLTSLADFIQICMCRGKIEICNSNFCGAGDDCMNVHGVHFKLVQRQNNEYLAAFMHPQTHGFQPLRVGDTVAFISAENLLEYGRAKILSAALINEYEIALTFDAAPPAGCDILEDISACPTLLFANNTVNRIITRGILYTSRGECEIRSNHFISSSMSGILLSDDAQSWYESGMCTDVTIENNTFDYCGETPILIKPENCVHNGAVHQNITVRHNFFPKYNDYCIRAKSADRILLSKNTYSGGKHIFCENCTHVTDEDA